MKKILIFLILFFCSGQVFCQGVIIQPKANVMVQHNAWIRTTGTGGLLIQSDATGTGSLIGSQGFSFDGTGSATVERYLILEHRYLISSSTGGQTVKDFLEKNLDIPIRADVHGDPVTPTTYWMKDFVTTSDAWNTSFFNNDFFATSGYLANPEMQAGKGYLVWTWSANQQKIKFKGAINPFTTSESPNFINVPVYPRSTGVNGWNCIGNPFTSAIKVYDGTEDVGSDNFLDVNGSNLDASSWGAYFWNDAATPQDWEIINRASSSITYAQVGQGFIVKSKSTVSSVKFTESMQKHYGDLQMKSGSLDFPQIKLFATGNNKLAATMIKFIDGTSKGLDVGYDAGILKSDPSFAIYTKLVEDNGVEFQLQCLPTNQYSSLVIPVGIDSKASGEITFSAETVHLDPKCKVILEDKVTNTFTDLSMATYKTAVQANTSTSERFFLHTGDIISGIEDPGLTGKLTAYAKSNVELHILGEVGDKSEATLYDALGHEVLFKTLGGGSLNIIGLPNLKSGLYFLNINDKGTTQTIKVMVKK